MANITNTGPAPNPNYQAPQSLDPAQLQGLISHLSNSMGMDEQAQQIALNRQMEGYGYGSAINNYLMNDVYGQILGVNFQNPDYSQYLQQTAGTEGQYVPPTTPQQHYDEVFPQVDPAEKAKWGTASGLGGGVFTAGPDASTYMNGPPSDAYIQQMMKDHGTWTNMPGNTAQASPQQAQVPTQVGGQLTESAFQPGKYISGQAPSALGKAMPKGTYTQGGKSFDPNMNSTWAKFLAPTMGKVSQLGDAQMQAIQRQMPRGGEQDRAISDAIAQKYGTMMGGWQSLVPQAMSGLQNIGQSLYFQQPSYTGGSGTMAGLQSGDQNASLNAQQMALQNQQYNNQLQQQKSQNKSGIMGLLGGALGAGVSALTGGLGGGLASSLLGLGNKGSNSSSSLGGTGKYGAPGDFSFK